MKKSELYIQLKNLSHGPKGKTLKFDTILRYTV